MHSEHDDEFRETEENVELGKFVQTAIPEMQLR